MGWSELYELEIDLNLAAWQIFAADLCLLYISASKMGPSAVSQVKGNIELSSKRLISRAEALEHAVRQKRPEIE